MSGPGEVTPMARNGTRYERTITTAERDAEIARYKIGRRYRDVAEHFGMSISGVHDAHKRALAAAVVPAGREAIAAELVKLDTWEDAAVMVLRANHIHISDGQVVRDDGQPITDHKPVLMAIDRLLRVSERRSKLLGLDAPTKQTIHVLTEDVVDAALREAAEEHARLTADPAPSAG